MKLKSFVIFAFIFSFFSCTKNYSSDSKSKNGEMNENPKTASVRTDKSTENVEKNEDGAKSIENPEIIKLNKVLVSMSERCKAAIPNGNPQEFLDDLHRVLAAEENFPKDDLSLYYLVDKKHTVSDDYVPKNLVKLVKNDDYIINKNTLSLRPDAEQALRIMARAAKNDGVTLDVSSTYRSYEYQKNLFQYWVDVDGLEEAERESARPGTSQHQLGAAIDFGSITDDFDTTPAGKWIYAHGSDYGWSLSFPKGYEDVTGYRWECWHFRYIGKEACDFQKKWFSDIQQFALEFINAWKNID